MAFTSITRSLAAAALVAVSGAASVPATEIAALSARQDNASSDHLVFCHFMVGVVGDRSSSADYDADMQGAKAAGIDAFALNIGTDDYTSQQLEYAYESAANNDFKVFISFDFNWYDDSDPGNVTSIAETLNKFGVMDAQLMIDDKAFVSSFAGDALDVPSLREQTTPELYIVPNFESTTDSTNLDGVFNWIGWDNNGDNKAPTDGNTVTVEDGDDAYMAAIGSSGKDYMAPVSPWFFTHFGPEVDYSKNWVFPGDTLWYDRWNEILALQPRFIEIITWNDYGESHYIGRLDSPHGDDGNSKWTYGFPHNGWLEMAKPFIQAYHDGANDVSSYIAEDQITYWHRPTLAGLDCDSTDTTMEQADNSTGNYFMGRPNGWETMEDSVFVITMLTEAGQLTVTTGNTTETFEAPAGSAKFSVPMAAGDISLSLARGGSNVLEGKSGMGVSDTCICGIYNFNAYVGTLPAGDEDTMLPEGYAMIMDGLHVDSCGPQ